MTACAAINHAVQAAHPPRIAVVIAAHIPDARNCELLAASLASVTCHHPGEAVAFVVDNASPARGLVAAAVGTSGSTSTRVRREAMSLGQLGAYAAAERLLRGNTSERLPYPEAIDTLVFLQHSTALAAPVRLPRGCSAAALSTLVNASTGGGWLDSNEYGMKWASAVAEALGIPCALQGLSGARERALLVFVGCDAGVSLPCVRKVQRRGVLLHGRNTR